LASVNALPDCAISATDMEAADEGGKSGEGDILLIKWRNTVGSRHGSESRDVGPVACGAGRPAVAGSSTEALLPLGCSSWKLPKLAVPRARM